MIGNFINTWLYTLPAARIQMNTNDQQIDELTQIAQKKKKNEIYIHVKIRT